MKYNDPGPALMFFVFGFLALGLLLISAVTWNGFFLIPAAFFAVISIIMGITDSRRQKDYEETYLGDNPPEQLTLLSPCCKKKIYETMCDGMLIGKCIKCETNVMRRNPHTHHLEWLDGKSPFVQDQLRLVS